MPVENVHRAVLIDDLSITVSAWRWICDACGSRETFHDNPRPPDVSGWAAQNKGWKILWGPDTDGEKCACPACAAAPLAKCEAERKE